MQQDNNTEDDGGMLIVRMEEDLVVPRFLLIQDPDLSDNDVGMQLNEEFGRRCADLDFLRWYYRKLEKELPMPFHVVICSHCPEMIEDRRSQLKCDKCEFELCQTCYQQLQSEEKEEEEMG